MGGWETSKTANLKIVVLTKYRKNTALNNQNKKKGFMKIHESGSGGDHCFTIILSINLIFYNTNSNTRLIKKTTSYYSAFLFLIILNVHRTL